MSSIINRPKLKSSKAIEKERSQASKIEKDCPICGTLLKWYDLKDKSHNRTIRSYFGVEYCGSGHCSCEVLKILRENFHDECVEHDKLGKIIFRLNNKFDKHQEKIKNKFKNYIKNA